MTVGYSIGAAVVWVAGMVGSLDLAAAETSRLGLVPMAAGAWTLAVILALGWLFLGNADERRLSAALRTAYRRAGNQGREA